MAVAVLFKCGVGYETVQRAEKGLKQREEREVGGSRLESDTERCWEMRLIRRQLCKTQRTLSLLLLLPLWWSLLNDFILGQSHLVGVFKLLLSVFIHA